MTVMISASVDAFLLTVILLVSSSFYLYRRFTVPPLPFLLVLGHTLFIAYTLLLRRPPNIFTSLRIPLTFPVQSIRALLFSYAYDRPLGEGELAATGTALLPEHLEKLLAKLSSFDARAIYVRLGHEALSCAHCVSPGSYALFALPVPLLAYVREAALVGLLANGMVRAWALALLAGGAAAEAWYSLNGRVEVGRDGKGTFMWHDNLWTYRQLLFLVLPLALLLLPALPHLFPVLRRLFPSVFPTPMPPSSVQSLKNLPHTLSTLEHLLARAHLAPLLRSVILRDPELREKAGSWWEERKAEGTWGREDAEVKRVAKGVGLGYGGGEAISEEGAVSDKGPEELGRLEASAHTAVQALRYGYKPAVPLPTVEEQD